MTLIRLATVVALAVLPLSLAAAPASALQHQQAREGAPAQVLTASGHQAPVHLVAYHRHRPIHHRHYRH